MGSFWIFYWLFVAVIVAIVLVPCVKILHKAGYSGWWLLLNFIPIVNLVMLYVFAFADWPNLRRAEARVEPVRTVV